MRLDVNTLKEKIASFNKNDFGEYISYELEKKGASQNPPKFPIANTHPRLLFKSEDIPAIRKAFDRELAKNVVAEFKSLVESEIDGVLGEIPSGRSTNFNAKILVAVQAKAFDYAINGNEQSGYEAIYAILNYMLTCRAYGSDYDSCNHFGFTVYIAACVYDWCYPLLDEHIRYMLIAGAEHRLQREDPVTGLKSELNFPPYGGEPSISGHRTELTIQRNLLSMAVAIYDEVPCWWMHCGDIYYNDFVPVREVFYEGHMYPQGTSCYGPYRFISDMFGAWISKVAIGEFPYKAENMKEVVRSFLNHETAYGNMFPSGDGVQYSIQNRIYVSSIISSYLFNDPTVLAFAKFFTNDFSKFDYDTMSIFPAEMLICFSGGVEPAESRYADLPLVRYNGGIFGQMITRNKWGDDSAVTLMKIGERTCANHDHNSAGHFQIYYKGFLATDTGVYSEYGTPHWDYIHQSSMGHNCISVFNPEYSDHNADRSTDEGTMKYWYAGQQKRRRETIFYDVWCGEDYAVGKVLRHGARYEKDSVTPKLSYISGEYAVSYPANTVDYIERQMVTYYTGFDHIPMFFLVADTIDSAKPEFEKKFILQVPGVGGPYIRDNKVSICSGHGKLMMYAVTGTEKIEVVGGSDKTNYQLNGEQCGHSHIDMWGRVELTATKGNKKSIMLTVFEVSDSMERGSIEPVELKCEEDSFVGVQMGNLVSFFCTEEHNYSGDIHFEILPHESIDQKFFYKKIDVKEFSTNVFGVEAGKYEVSHNGITEIVEVLEGENFISFTAAAGKCEIKKL